MEVLLDLDLVKDLFFVRVDEYIECAAICKVHALNPSVFHVRHLVMYNIFVVSKRTYHDSHLIVRIRIEGPSERAQPATVRASEVLSLLAVVKDFPAHELLVVSDGSDAENLP